MMAQGLAVLGFVTWTTWVPLGAGAAVMSLVIGGGVMFGRWRARIRLAEASREEDLAWDDLLLLIEKRNRDRAAAGLPEQEPTDDELDELLARLPALSNLRPVELPEDRDFQSVKGSERRTGRRRWGNPTEIYLRSLLWSDSVHGLVVNRSTGGLGIFADREAPPGTPLQIRAAEAPSYVPAAQAEVRHCLKAGKGYILGCRFTQEVPWNVRVWFG